MASERRLAEIRERLAAATPGPWELYATERNVIAITKGRLRSGYRREIVHCSGFDCSNIDDPGQVRANAALIAHAPSDLAYLLDEIARLTRELEEAREQVRELRAYVAAEIEHTMHRVTCETCIVGGECAEEQDLWETMDQACNLAWELVRPGVTKLRVDAITGALIEARTSTEARGRE